MATKKKVPEKKVEKPVESRKDNRPAPSQMIELAVGYRTQNIPMKSIPKRVTQDLDALVVKYIVDTGFVPTISFTDNGWVVDDVKAKPAEITRAKEHLKKIEKHQAWVAQVEAQMVEEAKRMKEGKKAKK